MNLEIIKVNCENETTETRTRMDNVLRVKGFCTWVSMDIGAGDKDYMIKTPGTYFWKESASSEDRYPIGKGVLETANLLLEREFGPVRFTASIGVLNQSDLLVED